MPHHFIAKFVRGGGPDPVEELASIAGRAAEPEGHAAWFATRAQGAAWQPHPAGSPSVALIFAFNDERTIDLVVGEIRGRQPMIPDDPATQELYRDHGDFGARWLLADPIAFRLPSLESVPGTSSTGKTAAEAFIGMLTFAYWDFGCCWRPRTTICSMPRA